jgi:hypothetical protein
LKIAVILAGMLVLASTAYAAGNALSSGLDIIGSRADIIQIFSPGEGSGGLDIVGSKAGDIKIISPDAISEGIEIVGGRANNISISSTVPVDTAQCCDQCPAAEYILVCEVCELCNATPIRYPDGDHTPHLGVDAWYGRYWYASTPYTPKWPQI